MYIRNEVDQIVLDKSYHPHVELSNEDGIVDELDKIQNFVRRDLGDHEIIYDLTTHDVALLCDICTDTVRKWIYQGKIKCKKIPGINPSLRISSESLLEFTKIYLHGRYYIDDSMIRFVKNAPLYLHMKGKDDDFIDNLIKHTLLKHKKELKNESKS